MISLIVKYFKSISKESKQFYFLTPMMFFSLLIGKGKQVNVNLFIMMSLMRNQSPAFDGGYKLCNLKRMSFPFFA